MTHNHGGIKRSLEGGLSGMPGPGQAVGVRGGLGVCGLSFSLPRRSGILNFKAMVRDGGSRPAGGKAAE